MWPFMLVITTLGRLDQDRRIMSLRPACLYNETVSQNKQTKHKRKENQKGKGEVSKLEKATVKNWGCRSPWFFSGNKNTADEICQLKTSVTEVWSSFCLS
jgi:hypothetical protein